VSLLSENVPIFEKNKCPRKRIEEEWELERTQLRNDKIAR
jgi:hypothetical protein